MAGSNEHSSASSEWNYLIFALVIGGAGWVAWMLASEYIVLGVYFINRLQIMAWGQVMGLGERGVAYLDYLNSFFDGRSLADKVTWGEMTSTINVIGTVTRMPIAIASFIVVIVVYLRMKGDGFKEKLSLIKFANYQAEHWGTLTPSARFNPDLLEKSTMPSKTPSDWMHDLGLKVRLTSAGTLSEKARDVCEKAFVKQLGNGWAPIGKLPLHVRVLFAILVTHGTKHKGAFQLRQDVARVYADTHDPKKRDAALEELIKEHMANEKACQPFLEIAEKHAYVPTALIAILKEVRKRYGVLASAEFVWLKRIDRDLWYAMNDTGRNAFHVESAGIFSHYFYENVSKRAQSEPRVDNALLGLEDYISHHGIEEEEE